MIKAIIFDMNGVIVDDEHLHELAFKEVLGTLGVELSHKEYFDYCVGRTDEAGFVHVVEKFELKGVDIERLVRDKADAYYQITPSNFKSFPGCLELINDLRQAFRLALASSCAKKEVDMVLKAFELEQTFEFVITADDVKKGKPDPEPYLITAQKLKIRPEYCLVIEDAKNGVLSAKSAGMKCIAVTTTHKRDDLLNADIIFDSFSEITAELISRI